MTTLLRGERVEEGSIKMTVLGIMCDNKDHHKRAEEIQ